MRVLYAVFGATMIFVGALIYAFGPLVDFADAHAVERFVAIATNALVILGLLLIVMSSAGPRRKKGQADEQVATLSKT